MNNCKWCGAPTNKGSGPPLRPEWKRWRCRGCGSFGYVDEPSDQELDLIYQVAWKDSETHGYAAGSTDEKIANSILNAVNFPSLGFSKCLDYGGGKGYVARALIEKGCQDLTVFEPFGHNPGINAAKWINSMSTIRGETFDWIFMIEVLEHLRNPEEELVKVRQHLSPNGRLVITTPNARGWRARVEGFNWREIRNPTHINLFTAYTLNACLINAGYSDVQRIFRPVTYKAKGVSAFILSMMQRIGIDGGLRFIASNSNK